jgi:Flp pilus assembly protein TadG
MRGVTAAVGKAKAERGQAIVEFVLILPIFLGLIFAAIGFGLTLNSYSRVTDVARVAARAASIARFAGNEPCAQADSAATKAAAGLTLLGPPSCSCPDPQCITPGDPITVTVTIKSENALSNVPFLGLVLPTTLTGKATALVQ